LLDVLLPPFEQQRQIRIKVIAAGTGKALKLGEMGDVDVLFVHAREAEDAFLAAEHGIRREDVMYNTFELLGPEDDPAEIRGLAASDALQKISTSGATFISRGDDSGTHKRELLLWQAAGTKPSWKGYQESGQGMGATLTIADEMSAYVLTDRGTYLHFQEKIDLVPLAAKSEALHNPYGVIVVNPNKHAAVRHELASELVDYLISPEGQQRIADYRLHGETLFVPLRLSSN
jgi:tungstate transport system substrate-binding protein